jgi:uncharacterized membrane protein
MTYLILGLILFLGIHSMRIVADGARARAVERMGANAWKGVYTLVSLVGFALIVWGYGLSRAEGVFLWQPPGWTRHAAGLLMLVSMILLAAAYVPGNAIKAAVGHPMVASVKVWALAHLLSNGRAGDVVLFGAFLAWAVADFASLRRRDRAKGVTYSSRGAGPTMIAVGVGVALTLVFVFGLHQWLIGVRPY